MRRWLVVLALLLVGLPGAPARAGTVSSGYRVPWSVVFLPDRTPLVSERGSGRVYRIDAAGRRAVVAIVSGVVPDGEGGLLGLAVSPTYASDRWLYAYYTSSSDNRVVRFRLGSSAQQVVLSGIPKASNHNGGRIVFGPDRLLYIGTGDAGDTSRAQDRTSLGGKVLRVRGDGSIPGGSPFGSPVWSMGHRNVQGLAFDDRRQLWATEFGQNTYDEVNLIVRGGNYGWPEVEGSGTGGGRFLSPKLTWTTAEASPAGVAFAGGELHVGALRGQRLWDVPVRGSSLGTPVARYVGAFGRVRNATADPRGAAVWLTTSNCDGRGTCPSYADRVIRVPL